jgi:hypothetical protein
MFSNLHKARALTVERPWDKFLLFIFSDTKKSRPDRSLLLSKKCLEAWINISPCKSLVGNPKERDHVGDLG